MDLNQHPAPDAIQQTATTLLRETFPTVVSDEAIATCALVISDAVSADPEGNIDWAHLDGVGQAVAEVLDAARS
jgi:hypothetical protein